MKTIFLCVLGALAIGLVGATMTACDGGEKCHDESGCGEGGEAGHHEGGGGHHEGGAGGAGGAGGGN